MATPAIRTLKQKNPEDEIWIGGFDYLPSGSIWENNPHVSKYIQFPVDFHPTYWSQDVFNLEIQKINEIVLAKLKEMKLKPDTIKLVTLQPFKALHRIQRIGRELNIVVTDKTLELFPTQEEIDHVKKEFGNKLYFVVHQGAGNFKKAWDIGEAEETTRQLQKMTGWTPFILNNPKEPERIKIADARYLSDLPKQSIGITREIIRRAKFLVGTDSAPMHIASETKTPCVGLFTMTAIHETAPLSDNSAVIVTNAIYNNCPTNILEEKFTKALVRLKLENYRQVGVKRVIQALKLLKVIK